MTTVTPTTKAATKTVSAPNPNKAKEVLAAKLAAKATAEQAPVPTLPATKKLAPLHNNITQSKPIVVQQIAQTVEESPEDVMWQQYKSARPAIRTITDKGKHIKFTNYEYYTRERDVSEWLDNQLSLGGLPGITKGAFMTSTERNPMEVLRRQHIAEYLTEQKKVAAAAAAGEFQDMGSTANASSINPASTRVVMT